MTISISQQRCLLIHSAALNLHVANIIALSSRLEAAKGRVFGAVLEIEAECKTFFCSLSDKKNTGYWRSKKDDVKKGKFVLSFFVPPILPVYFCDKEQEKRMGLRRRPAIIIIIINYPHVINL